MDIGMILIQVKDGIALVVRCEKDGDSQRLAPAANAAELAHQVAQAIAGWFNATLDQDGLYLCPDDLQAAAQFPMLSLPTDAIPLSEAGRLLAPDASQNERWEYTHALRKTGALRVYCIGTGKEIKQYVSRAAAMQFAPQQAG